MDDSGSRAAVARHPGTAAAGARLLPIRKELPIHVDVSNKEHERNLISCARTFAAARPPPRLEKRHGRSGPLSLGGSFPHLFGDGVFPPCRAGCRPPACRKNPPFLLRSG